MWAKAVNFKPEIFMITDSLKLTGKLSIVVTGPDGKVKDTREINNLVVTTGKGFVASRMVGTANAVMSHMAVGAGSTAAAVGDSALGSELGRVVMTTPTASGAVATYVGNFPAGTGSGAVTEAGIFNAGSGGTMLCRSVFAVVNRGADDGMSITWQVTAS
jgi:hypothetical protein